MIEGFEIETQDLTEKDIELSRYVWQALNRSFNQGRSIKNREISAYVKNVAGVSLSGSRIRKMINWMHVKGYLRGLVATSKGYKKAESVEEMQNYVDSPQGRVDAISARMEAAMIDVSFMKTSRSHVKQKELNYD